MEAPGGSASALLSVDFEGLLMTNASAVKENNSGFNWRRCVCFWSVRSLWDQFTNSMETREAQCIKITNHSGATETWTWGEKRHPNNKLGAGYATSLAKRGTHLQYLQVLRRLTFPASSLSMRLACGIDVLVLTPNKKKRKENAFPQMSQQQFVKWPRAWLNISSL